MVPIYKSFAVLNATGTILIQHASIIHANNLITSSLPPTTTGQPCAECSDYIRSTSNNDSKVPFLELNRGRELSPPYLLPKGPALWQQDKGSTGGPSGPEAYYTVTASKADEGLEQVFYCPSQYRISSLPGGSVCLSPMGKHAFLSQYNTMMLSGSNLEYRESERIWTTTVTVAKPDELISVAVILVNGWAYISPTSSHFTVSHFTVSTTEPTMIPAIFTTTSTTCAESTEYSQFITTASSSFPRAKSSATTPPNSTPSASGWTGSNNGHVGYSQGDKIELGVGIGVGLGVGLPSLILAFVQYRRTRPETNLIPMTTRDNID
ncbi:hypothetical protein F4680DRAFT_440156 [Xylaria scruposa]|nr:hypothetical protein F4680DRAFT_440156 [Xylaria scruposa]